MKKGNRDRELYSTEAEQGILGGILNDNRTYDLIIGTIKEDDFYWPKHKTIYRAITSFLDTGKPADVLTIGTALEEQGKLSNIGGRNYLSELTIACPSSICEAHTGIVHDFAIRRRLSNLGHDLNRLSTENTDIDLIIDMAQQKTYELNNENGGRRAREVGEEMDKFTERIDNRGICGMETGFPDLDRKLSGLKPGNVYILAADTGMGKTTLAMNIATHLAQHGDRVMFFSLEMEYEELKDRIACSLARVDSSLLQSGLLEPSDCDKLAAQFSTLEKMPLRIDDGSYSPAHMRSQIRRMNPPPKLVIVDYIQLMEPGTKYENETVRITNNSKSLIRLAKEFDVPVIALSQLNRSSETRSKERRPTLASLRGSGSLEQDAYSVMFIYWAAYHYEKKQVMDASPDELREAELIISKNRGGQTGFVDLVFFREYNLFTSKVLHGYNVDR